MKELDISCFDYDVLLQKVIKTIEDGFNFEQPLTVLANDIAYGEGLFQNMPLSLSEQEALFTEVKRLGNNIKNTLVSLHVYRVNKLSHEFRGSINEYTVFFEETSRST
jgi:hypothetical protein